MTNFPEESPSSCSLYYGLSILCLKIKRSFSSTPPPTPHKGNSPFNSGLRSNQLQIEYNRPWSCCSVAAIYSGKCAKTSEREFVNLIYDIYYANYLPPNLLHVGQLLLDNYLLLGQDRCLTATGRMETLHGKLKLRCLIHNLFLMNLSPETLYL